MTDLNDAYSKIKTYVNGDMTRAAEVLDLIGETSDSRTRYRFMYVLSHVRIDIDEIDRLGNLGWDVANITAVIGHNEWNDPVNEFHVLMRKSYQLPIAAPTV